VRPETNVRLTDIAGDKQYSRLGNTGDGLLDDLINRLNQALGQPFEVQASIPNDLNISVSSGVYSLPDGRRMSVMRNGIIPTVGSVNMQFDTGVISGGTNLSFVLPTLTAGNYVKALIQYSFGTNAFNVTFGSENAVLASCGSPIILIDFEPIAMLELRANGSGQGLFYPISKSNIITITGSMDYEPSPVEEKLDSVGQNIFDLTTIRIPSSRSRLMVFVNGVYQVHNVHYSVTSDTRVTFSDTILADAEVLFRVI
jgi:hypothetical protein